MSLLKTSEARLWEEEYDRAGIPSSVRSQPSNVVKEFVEAFPDSLGPACAIDIGCGLGRNSLYLAERGFNVIAMDYAPSMVERLSRTADTLGLSGRIQAICQDVSKSWPIADAAVDLAIDTFCFKHQIHEEALRAYVTEATRVMKSNARFLLFLATKEDGYYCQFPTADQGGPGTVIRDPGNGILSRLYDSHEIVNLFGAFSVIRHVVKLSENTMHGTSYKRTSHVFWLKHA